MSPRGPWPEEPHTLRIPGTSSEGGSGRTFIGAPGGGRYQLLGEIASGGMATVHFGALRGEAGFQRVVAIKRLHPQFSRDEHFVSMFIDEARLSSRVRHVGVVPVIDVVSDGRELWLVMEYVHGESLARLLSQVKKAGARVPEAIIASVMLSVLDGLHAAHEATDESGRPLGIVHRDISPQNILLGVDGLPRVLDFGVAKASGRLVHTGDGALKGKLGYMPPEQLRGEMDLDRRADIFAVGVVLWEMLVGRRLCKSGVDGRGVMGLLEMTIPPPSDLRPDIHPAWDALVLRACNKAREGRFADAATLAHAIHEVMPPASAREIAAWVRSTAATSLAERHAQWRQWEEDVALVDRQEVMMELAATRVDLGRSARSSGETPEPLELPPRRRSLPRRWPVALALVALGGAWGLGWALGPSRHAKDANAPVMINATATSAMPIAVVPLAETRDVHAGIVTVPLPHVPLPAEQTLPAEEAAAAPAPPALPAPPAGTAKRGKPAPRHKRISVAPKAAQCSPPFTIDAQGIKRYKRECL